MNSYFCSVPSLLIYILHEYPLLPCAVEKQATLEKDQPVAFVSQSTRAFRKRLRDSDVQFTMPADVDSKIAKEDISAEAYCQELLALGSHATTHTPSRTQRNDGGFQSFIQVMGHEAIGGLYEVVLEQAELAVSSGWGAMFRMNRTSTSKSKPNQAFNRSGGLSADDAPLLLSRAPFLHGTVRTAKLSFCGAVQTGDIIEQRLEFKMSESFLLPCNIRMMRNALANMAAGVGSSFEASFTAEKDSARFCRDGHVEEVLGYKFNGGVFEVESRSGGGSIISDMPLPSV